MALKYTGDELIESVRNISPVSQTEADGTADADVLRHLSEVLRAKMVPEILKQQEDYFVVTTNTTVTSAATSYRIPSRSIGNRIRWLYWLDSSSNRKKLQPLRRADLTAYNESSTSEPAGYYLEGNYIQLVPTGGSFTGTLEISFYFRPSDLVKESAARQVVTVDTGTGKVTFSTAVPSGWSDSDTFDVHSQESGAEVKVWDATCSAVSGTSSTFSTAIDGTGTGTHAVEVGDWVCLAGESVIPAIPKEMHPMLVEGAALQLAKGFEDELALKIHAAEFQGYKEGIVRLADERDESNKKNIRGRGGVIFQGKRWW